MNVYKDASDEYEDTSSSPDELQLMGYQQAQLHLIKLLSNNKYKNNPE